MRVLNDDSLDTIDSSSSVTNSDADVQERLSPQLRVDRRYLLCGLYPAQA